MITGEVEAVDRKQKIRDRYKGVDISELEVIPAKIIEDLETSSVIRRVAAYIRVSKDNDEQTYSYEVQKNYYTDYIQAQPGWVFVGIYDFPKSWLKNTPISAVRLSLSGNRRFSSCCLQSPTD